MLVKPLQFGRLADTHTVPPSVHLTSFTSYREHTNIVLKVPVSGLFAGFDVTAVLLMNQVF